MKSEKNKPRDLLFVFVVSRTVSVSAVSVIAKTVKNM